MVVRGLLQPVTSFGRSRCAFVFLSDLPKATGKEKTRRKKQKRKSEEEGVTEKRARDVWNFKRMKSLKVNKKENKMEKVET